jgi:putative transposase
MVFCISQSVYRYTPRPNDDHIVREQLSTLADLHSSWGFWMMHHHLRKVGWKWNHKKVYRIYTEMKLNMRRKYKKRLPARVKEPLLQPIHPNVTWSMDFMHDGLIGGKSFRSFNVMDDYNREVLNITIEKGMPSKRVIRELDKLIEWRGKPERMRVDNGPEFISEAMKSWCRLNEIELKFIQKGKPTQNGYIERFNRTFREDVLSRYAFESLDQARTYTYAWMWSYNNERPHSSLGWKTPTDFNQERLQGYALPTFLHDKDKTWKHLVLNAPN